MIRLITTILFLCAVNASAQFGQPRWKSTGPQNPCPVPPCPVVNLSFTPISQNTEYMPRYGGPSRWNLESGAKIIPDYTGNCPPLTDCHTAFYFRLTWLDCESSTVQGDYTKLNTDPTGPGGVGRMRARVTEALNNGQLFAFGIMQRYEEVCAAGGFNSGVTYDGTCSAYPEYLHDQMQGNSNPDHRDFSAGNIWVEAAKSPQWKARWAALHIAIMNWMNTTFITPTAGPRAGQSIRVADALAYVDIRGHGSYGEWHNCCLGNGYDNVYNWPGYDESQAVNGVSPVTGTYPDVAAFKATIDAQINAYTNYPCVVIINSMDAGHFDGLHHSRIPIEVAHYLLTVTNTFGKIGFRRDQWGDDSEHYNNYLENNPEVFMGVDFNTEIINRYKFNYFTGEMPGYNCANAGEVCRNGVNFGWLPEQALELHPTWVGNGNYGGNAPTGPQATMDAIREFFRLNGPRILPTGGTMTATLQQSTSFNVTLHWENRGNSVIHRAWTTQIIIKNSGGTTVFTGNTTFQVKGFDLTGGTPQIVSSNLTLPGSVTPGTGYNAYVRLVDPLNYAQPFYLGITPRESDGSYLIRPNITVVAGP